jgi:anti-sigma factor RsiW
VTCREFADFIGEYLSGDLAPDVRAAFERHLSRCSNCQKYLAGYREIVRLGKLALADDEAPPADVPEDLIAAILAARRSADLP